MTRRGIACAGNWIADIVHTIDAWPQKSDLVHIRHEVMGVGGGAANVVLDLAALQTGLPLYAVGLLGTDLHGTFCRDACVAAGVDGRWLASTSDHLTAHTLVMNVPGDSRTFFYNAGTNDALSEADVPVEAIAAEGVRLFYLGYLNLMGRLDAVDADGTTGSARLLARARGAGMVTCVDLVSAATPSFASTVAAALPHIDYLFLNEVEAARATGLAISGPDDKPALLAAARALQQGGAKTVVLHTGAVALWLDDAPHWVAPDPVDPAQIVSPVGAGDAFCAGEIYAIHEGWSPQRALTLGHRAAAASLRGATATDGIPPLSDLI
ncbi:MAG: carbohydrate kinase family protein [Rhodobacteraceae bacterium]|nr:carbohydrate kinase family protein [Paracoccaceae bacterium]MCF8521107.1 carbohydrate kinase family protein [Paracoccaceae bacterium]